MARLDILKHFEMLKRKFNPGVDERSRLQLSYLGEELSQAKLAEFVKAYNEMSAARSEQNKTPLIKLTQRGASSIDLPPALMISFFEPLFANIKQKVTQLAEQAKAKDGAVNFIFMVGGFSESPYLKAEIKKEF